MKARFFIFIGLICILFSKNAAAQGTFSGCLVYSTNTLYRNEYQTTGYFSSRMGVTRLSNGYCYWSQTASSSVSCTACTGPNSVTYDSSTGAFISCDGPVAGVRGTFYMVYCPLDDYSAVLLFTAGILTFALIKGSDRRISKVQRLFG